MEELPPDQHDPPPEDEGFYVCLRLFFYLTKYEL